MSDPASTRSRRSLETLWQHGLRASASQRYGTAIVAGVLAFLARLALIPLWDQELPYVFYYPVTLFSSLYGGLRAALVGAAIMGVATWLWVLHPVGSLFPLDIPRVTGLIAFGLMDAIIAWLGAQYRALLEERHATALALDAHVERERERAALLQGILDTSPSAIWMTFDRQCSRILGNAAGNALLAAPPRRERLAQCQ